MDNRYTWDPMKAGINLKNHKISFDEAIQIFDGPTLSREQYHQESGEWRELSFGFLGDVIILAVAHMDRDGQTRIISARKATKNERRMFYDYIEKTLG